MFKSDAPHEPGRVTIQLLSPSEIPRMRAAGAAAAATLDRVIRRLEPGVSGADIDAWVRAHTKSLGGRPSQLGYQGFPAAVCISVNDVVCHGIPQAKLQLREGDIVNIDVTTELEGFHGDTSRTVGIGKISATRRTLIETAERAMMKGIEEVRPGGRLGDIGAAIQDVAEGAGLSVVRGYCGHGIGRRMHQAPSVPFVGTRGRGLRLRPGLALTVEPMLNAGGPETAVDGDGWTVRTVDGGDSAQFEHTLLVTATGFEILTRPPSPR